MNFSNCTIKAKYFIKDSVFGTSSSLTMLLAITLHYLENATQGRAMKSNSINTFFVGYIILLLYSVDLLVKGVIGSLETEVKGLRPIRFS